MTQTIVILGAGGRLGAAAVSAFARAGWNVIAHRRGNTSTQATANVRIVSHPLESADALASDVRHADIVLYAVNPPYTAWPKDAQRLLNHAIALTQRLNATFMLPGNVYNYGRAMTLNTTEGTPQNPHTVKGSIRVEMERSLATAAHHGMPTIIVRAGDFFGAGAGSWFDLIMAKKLAQGTFTYPGTLDVPHAWAYLPDLANAFVALATRRAMLPAFSTFHFAGYTLTGNDWLGGLQPIAQSQRWTNAGTPLKVASIPWGFMKLCAPLVPIWRELVEMRYLWEVPHGLADHALVGALGAAPHHTPFAEALSAALTQSGTIRA